MTISAQLISSGIQFLEGVGVGSFGGFISGLLGITAGGVLVPAIVIILGFSQHRAQALSLAALLPPTSIHGVLQYRRRGHEISPREVTLLALAFLAGSFCGASIAGVISDRPLRWMYVGYLVLLTLLLILRHKDGPEAPDREEDIVSSRSETMALLIIGLIAGISSRAARYRRRACHHRRHGRPYGSASTPGSGLEPGGMLAADRSPGGLGLCIARSTLPLDSSHRPGTGPVARDFRRGESGDEA